MRQKRWPSPFLRVVADADVEVVSCEPIDVPSRPTVQCWSIVVNDPDCGGLGGRYEQYCLRAGLELYALRSGRPTANGVAIGLIVGKPKE